MDKLIDDLDKKISKAQNITGNLFDDLRDIRISFNRLKAAINYTRCCKSDSEQLFDFLEWFDNYCTVDVKPNKEDVELYLSK